LEDIDINIIRDKYESGLCIFTDEIKRLQFGRRIINNDLLPIIEAFQQPSTPDQSERKTYHILRINTDENHCHPAENYY